MAFVKRKCVHCESDFMATERNVSNGFGNFCSRSCSSKNYKASQRKPIEERFWNKVSKPNAEDECWEWTGATSRGYGTLRIGDGVKANILAHRMSYEIHKGEIPLGMHVCHKCDNPLCVNPSHLFFGTAQENVNNKVSKGRQHKGESTPTSKLTKESVIEMRRIHLETGMPTQALGELFGVTRQCACQVVRRRTWKHI